MRLPGTVGAGWHRLDAKEVVTVTRTFRWCSECRDETAFEVPPCEDGHGADCFDLACAECGAAVVLGLHDDGAGGLLDVPAAA